MLIISSIINIYKTQVTHNLSVIEKMIQKTCFFFVVKTLKRRDDLKIRSQTINKINEITVKIVYAR